MIADGSSEPPELEELMKKTDVALYRRKRGEKSSIEEY